MYLGKKLSEIGVKTPHCSIQRVVLATGYVDKVLLGKTYSRTVCVNKLMHKTLHRFLLNKMEDIEAPGRLTGFSTTMNWHCHEF